MSKNWRSLFKLSANLKQSHAWIIAGLLLAMSMASEVNHAASYTVPLKRFVVPIVIAGATAFCLLRVVVALFNRLLRVIEESTVATKRDLLLILFTYFCVIVGFGIVYLVLETFVGKAVFDFTEFKTRVRLIDNLYLSGITITTGGNILPVYWFSKFLLVLESLLGVWLTAIVLGFFIGSLLGSQQQVKQATWYADLQKAYVPVLDGWASAISKIETELGTTPPEEMLRNIRDGRQKLLQTMAALVENQYDPVPSATVSANWMQFYRAVDAPANYLELARLYTSMSYLKDGLMTKLLGVLVMREWGDKPKEMPGDGELVIPVYDGKDDKERLARQLPGAPLAILKPKGLDVVSDSDTIDLGNQDENIRTKFRDYFAQHSAELRSFASLRISVDLRSNIEVGESGESALPMGVVNIQSSQPYLLGPTEPFQAIIVDMIKPFGRYLGRLIICENTIQAKNATGNQTS